MYRFICLLCLSLVPVSASFAGSDDSIVCMVQLGPILGISDALVFLICVPGILGLYFLAPIVKSEMESYFARIDSGEIRKFR